MKNKNQAVRLKNLLSNEIWICEDYNNIREIDGVMFIEVHKEDNPRKFWIRRDSLVKDKTRLAKIN